MDWSAVIAALITALGAFIGVYISNRKSSALIEYRVQQIERRLDSHNHFSDRIVTLEKFQALQEARNKTIFKEIDDLKKGESNGA